MVAKKRRKKEMIEDKLYIYESAIKKIEDGKD